MYNTIKVFEKSKNVVEFRLFRPQVANAYNDEMITDLLKALSELSSQTRVLLITGEGKNFQGGADLDWLKQASEKNFEFNRKLSMKSFKFFESLRHLSIPVVVKITGFCGGGGTGIVASCDIAIASVEASFSIAEVRWGMTPSIIFPALYPSIGTRNISRYAFTGDIFSAQRALEIGLVSETSSPDLLDDRVEKIVRSILQSSHSAIKSTKKELLKFNEWTELQDSLVSTHAKQRMSADAKHGLNAFKEKNSPSWN